MGSQAVPVASSDKPAEPRRSSLRALGRELGVSVAVVRKGIRNGRLARSVGQDELGRPVIVDVELAKQEWTENSSRSQEAPRQTVVMTLAEAQRRVALERARGMRLANNQKRGRLILAATATKAAFESARVIRESLLNIPARIAAELAAETDPARVHIRLDAELRLALTESADRLQRV